MTTTNFSALNWEVICNAEIIRAPKTHTGNRYSKRRKQTFKSLVRYAYNESSKTHIVQNLCISDRWVLFVTPTQIDYRKYNFGKLERWESYKWNGSKLITRGHAGVKFYTPRSLVRLCAVNHQGSYWDYNNAGEAFAKGLVQAALVLWAKEVNPWMNFNCSRNLEQRDVFRSETESLISLLRFPHYPWGCEFISDKGSMRPFHKPVDWAVKKLFNSTGKACKKAYLRKKKLEAKWFPLCRQLQQKGWTSDHLLDLFEFGLTRDLTTLMKLALILDMTPKKVLRLMKGMSPFTAHDILNQLRILRGRGIDLDISNTRCLESTHDALTLVYQEVAADEPEYELWHYPQLDTLAKHQWVNGKYNIVIPQTNKELWEWSNHFRNCVGSYAESIHNGTSIVFALADKDTGEKIHCVELRPEVQRNHGLETYSTHLVQCSTFRNDVDENVYEIFEEEITKVKIAPEFHEREIVFLDADEPPIDWQAKFNYLVSKLHQERLRRERTKAERLAARFGMEVATAPDAATYFGTHENVVDAPNLEDIPW